MTALHAAAIRGRREALGLTQKQAAELAGVTEPTWQRFETGGKKVSPYLASRCMKLLNGEIKILQGTPRKRIARRRKEPTAIRILRDGWGITQETAAELAKVLLRIRPGERPRGHEAGGTSSLPYCCPRCGWYEELPPSG